MIVLGALLFILQLGLNHPVLAASDPSVWRGIVGDRFTTDEVNSITQMAGTNPLVQRSYFHWDDWYNSGGNWEDSKVTTYANQGYKVMVVLRYRPPQGYEGNVAAWRDYVRSAVDHYAAMPNVMWIQVTNEANAGGTSDSDGYYVGARDALIQGVIAGNQEKTAHNYNVKIGFNFYYGLGESSDNDFWSYLGANGGSAFSQATDWAGIDAYPGTFILEPNGDYAAMHDALVYMRSTSMPQAGLGSSVPIYVAETGFGVLGKSEDDQVHHLNSFWNAVWDLHDSENVRMFIWFEQVDRAYWSANPADHMGLTDVNYVPRKAWYTYQNLLGIQLPENNLTLNKPAVASSQQSGNETYRANDGSCATRWAASSGSVPQWWKVDLGSINTISQFHVVWEYEGVEYKYKLETSTDNVNWTTVVDRSTGNPDQFMIQTEKFAPVAARYVRITVYSGYSGWVSFYELGVYN